MTDKITLTTVSSFQNDTSAVNVVNSNSSVITTAINNTISRDGTSPNQMLNSLDMNSNRIINLLAPVGPTEPLRLQDLQSFVGGSLTVYFPTGGTTNQILKKNSNTDFDVSFTSSPSLTSLTLSSTINKITLTQPATGSTITIADGKTFVVNKTLTLTGTDSTVMTFPTTSQTIPGLGQINTFTNVTDSSSPSTGSIVTIGGVGIEKNLYVGGASNFNGGGGVSVNAGGLTVAAGGLTIGAGNTSLAPINLLQGPVKTTATGGSVEYDGTCFYATPVNSNRAVISTEHILSPSSNFTLSNVNTAQQAFGVTAAGQITLPSSTTYLFEAVYLLTNTGTTNHQWETLFGGTASLTSIAYRISGNSSSSSTPAAGSFTGFATSAAAIQATPAQTSATENAVIHLTGIVRINSGGTFIPQIQLTAAPGGVQTMLTNSFFRMWPIGSNTVTTVGNWS